MNWKKWFHFHSWDVIDRLDCLGNLSLGDKVPISFVVERCSCVECFKTRAFVYTVEHKKQIEVVIAENMIDSIRNRGISLNVNINDF